MTLQIVPSESYAIAMRHLDHKLDTENGFIANNIQPLIAIPNQYIYVRKALLKFLSNIDKLREKIREDSTKTDTREVILQAKLSEIEVEYKQIVNKTLSDFLMQADKLRVLKTKLDNIINTLTKLLDYKLKDGVMESIENKKNKVATLNDPVPTMAQISTVLRIEELQNQTLINRWVNFVFQKAIPVFETQESDDSTLDKVIDNTEEAVRSAVYTLAYNRCKPILEPSDDSLIFLNSTLKQSTEKFISATRNRNQVKNKVTELLTEYNNKAGDADIEVLQQQVLKLEKFIDTLGNQFSEVPHYFIERSLEADVVADTLVSHPKFAFYAEFLNLLAINLTDSSNPDHQIIFEQVEDLHDMILQKVSIDHMETHLNDILTKAKSVKDNTSRQLSSMA